MKTKALFEIEIDTNGIYCGSDCRWNKGSWCDLLIRQRKTENNIGLCLPECRMAVDAMKDETVKTVIAAALAQAGGI